MENIKKYKKNIIVVSSFFILGWLFIITGAAINGGLFAKSSPSTPGVDQLAQTGRVTESYVPLVDIPGFEPENADNLALFLKTLYRWGISIAVVLSILFIILGGIQYMTTDSISNKSQGKEKIKGAVMGLILAISSYLILYTINPQLVDLSKVGSDTIEIPEGPPEPPGLR